MTRKTASVNASQTPPTAQRAVNEADQDDRHPGEHLLGQVSHRLIASRSRTVGQVSRVTGGVKPSGELPQVLAQGDR